jgi:hypothetical protein
MKYFALIMTLVFSLFAGWQFNDPDPVLWVTLYLTAAYVSWQAYRGKFNPELLMILALLALAGAVNSWQGMSAWEGINPEDLSMKSNNQELAREAFGLGICAIVAVVYWVNTRR